MLARVLFAAVNGIEAFLMEVEVNSGTVDNVLISPHLSIEDGVLPACFGAAPLCLPI